MANAERGETRLSAGGREYVLRYTINSLCELEDALGQGFNTIAAMMADPEKLRLKTLRAVVWAGLLDKQPEATAPLAGEIIGEIGTPAAMAAVAQAFSNAFAKGEADAARP